MLRQNNQFQSNEERIYYSCRINILVMIGFTLINVILLALKSNTYFLFSAYIPLFLYTLGVELSGPYIVMGFALAMFVILLYFICFLMSKKKYVWMIVALVLFSIDTLFFLYNIYLIGFEANVLLDLFFHGWVLFYMIRSLTVVKVLKRQREEANTKQTLPEQKEEESIPATTEN